MERSIKHPNAPDKPRSSLAGGKPIIFDPFLGSGKIEVIRRESNATKRKAKRAGKPRRNV